MKSSSTRFRHYARQVPGLDAAYRWVLRKTQPVFQPVRSDTPPPPGDFARLLFGHTGSPVHKWLHYCSIYDEVFSKFRNTNPVSDIDPQVLRVLEIGVLHGGSLEVWRQYFGPNAVIYGIDIDPTCVDRAPVGTTVRIGSQVDPKFLARTVSEMGGVDVVIDDGSHICAQQLKAFDVLFPLLSQGGLYLVEDTHTSYSLLFGGGYRRPKTFINETKKMIDGLHKYHFRSRVGKRQHLAWKTVRSLRFYDGIVVIEKELRDLPRPGEFGLPLHTSHTARK